MNASSILNDGVEIKLRESNSARDIFDSE